MPRRDCPERACGGAQGTIVDPSWGHESSSVGFIHDHELTGTSDLSVCSLVSRGRSGSFHGIPTAQGPGRSGSTVLALHPFRWSGSCGTRGSVPTEEARVLLWTSGGDSRGRRGAVSCVAHSWGPKVRPAWAQRWGGAGLGGARLSCHAIGGPGLQAGEMAGAGPMHTAASLLTAATPWGHS